MHLNAIGIFVKHGKSAGQHLSSGPPESPGRHKEVGQKICVCAKNQKIGLPPQQEADFTKPTAHAEALRTPIIVRLRKAKN